MFEANEGAMETKWSFNVLLRMEGSSVRTPSMLSLRELRLLVGLIREFITFHVAFISLDSRVGRK